MTWRPVDLQQIFLPGNTNPPGRSHESMAIFGPADVALNLIRRAPGEDSLRLRKKGRRLGYRVPRKRIEPREELINKETGDSGDKGDTIRIGYVNCTKRGSGPGGHSLRRPSGRRVGWGKNFTWASTEYPSRLDTKISENSVAKSWHREPNRSARGWAEVLSARYENFGCMYNQEPIPGLNTRYAGLKPGLARL